MLLQAGAGCCNAATSILLAAQFWFTYWSITACNSIYKFKMNNVARKLGYLEFGRHLLWFLLPLEFIVVIFNIVSTHHGGGRGIPSLCLQACSFWSSVHCALYFFNWSHLAVISIIIVILNLLFICFCYLQFGNSSLYLKVTIVGLGPLYGLCTIPTVPTMYSSPNSFKSSVIERAAGSLRRKIEGWRWTIY